MRNDQVKKTSSFRTGRDLLHLVGSKQAISSEKKLVASFASETEEILYSIWKDLLRHDNFDVKDDFFHVGGNSLKAVQLLSRISTQCFVDITLTDIFLHPTISQLAAVIASKEGRLSTSARINKKPRPAQIPLSFSQERLWFIDQLEGSVQYHTPELLRIKGPVSVDALQFALQTIINRHEVLRTVIRNNEGRPYQVIKDKDNWRLTIVNGEQYRRDDNRLQHFIAEIISQPFNLAEDHMLRATLVKFDENDHLLVVTLHHISSDGWSMSVFVKELTELYGSYIEGRASVLDELEIQYADYAIWQREHLQGDLLKKKISYWQNKLQGVVPVALPTDYPRSATLSTSGASINFTVEKELNERLQELSREHGVTMFMTLVAVFNVLLHRYSSQEDICIGTPIAGRQQQELEGLIGFFVNTLALRTEVTGDTSFAELLQRVRSTTLEAYEHQEVPFEKVVETVVKERDNSRNGLFQVMIVWQNTPEKSELRLGKLSVSKEEFVNNTSKFDLTLLITETTNGIEGTVEYSTDLFEQATINRMIEHFKQLLFEVTEQPARMVDELRMITREEQQQILTEFNNTFQLYSSNTTIVGLFEEQVQKTPKAVAVVFEQQYLTYEELNQKANRLAYYLRSRGIKKETMVPICIERSLEMIIGVLAILKSGAAYVPIDPEYPEDRVNYILQDIGAEMVLSSTESKLKLSESQTLEMIDLVTGWETLSGLEANNVSSGVNSDALAYVLYTSGSTGEPKGVRMSGNALVNLLLWQQQQFKKGSRRVLQFASLNFDVSFQEIFSTICFGSTLFLISSDRRKDVSEIVKDLRLNKITHLFIPYIVLKTIAEYLQASEMGDIVLEDVIVAGEQLKLTEDIKNLVTQKSIRIVNQYGPTEAHVVTSYVVDSSSSSCPPLPPIGKPISNTRIYIVTKGNQLCPIGVAGEICISGRQVARGYLNRPALTSEKFVADPFFSDGGKMYRTGDIGKWRPDGNLEYVGRADDQVKVRGYRIELGEIESVLNQCEYVKQAVILAREDSSGNKLLVSYVVPTGSFNREGMIAFLKNKLPEYMVPGLWVEMKNLPVTRNGKLDKRALPEPDLLQTMSEYVAPRNDVERRIAKIWEDLLQVKKVGVFDNFFHIGGHSLIAMRVVSLTSRDIEVEVTIRELFAYSTVSQLADHLHKKTRFVLPEIKRHSNSGRIPLSFSQERLWFIHQLEGSLHYHLTEVFHLKGQLDQKALGDALHTIIRRHEILRTIFWEDEFGPCQLPQDNDNFNLRVINGFKYHNDANELSSYINELICEPYDLSKDELLRAHLIQLADQDYKLIITIHHIASDGWSTAILVKELVELYSSYVEKKHCKLAPLPIQYSDYAIWQRQYLQGEFLAKKIEYWKKKLQNVTPLQLPTDYARPAIQSTAGATAAFTISKDLTAKLRQLSDEQGVTLFMTMLTVYNVLFHMYSRQCDICVGTVVADRNQRELEDLIGFFVNTLVLRTEVTGYIPFTELLQKVKSNLLEAYENQEVPFEKVVETVVVERDLSRNPIFQVMIVWQNTPPVPTTPIGDVELSREPVPITKTKFDISFTITETADGLEGLVEYCSDLYSYDTINRMNEHFTKLLYSISAMPEKRIGELDMVPIGEERQLLESFNGKIIDVPKNNTVELFERQALNCPYKVAVADQKAVLTYQQLDERANQLAHYLRDKGVRKETIVPVCLDRSIEIIVGLLAILKAGGAYVPIDPEYPEERITYMLEDTAASIVITNAGCRDKIRVKSDADLIELDLNNWSELEKLSKKRPEQAFSLNQLAYVIYTSGSTGKPKGVMIEHRALANLITWHIQEYNVTSSSNATAMAGVGFDAFGWEIWPYLSAGATVFLIDDNIRLSPTTLISLFNEKRISHSFISTALVADFVNDSRQCTPIYLKYVLTGGDKLSALDLEGINYSVVNNYGPTEYTVVTSSYAITGKEPTLTPPIGKPIANTFVRLLNEQERAVPIGVIGEISVGGEGLARGYLNRTELTQEKFVKIDFGNGGSERIYKTGDLGRWLPDGNIEYIGRKDDQVKIRGYRIELGEIESVLLQSGLVSQAIVLVKTDNDGNKCLVGYVVGRRMFDKAAINAYLQQNLPKYMIPAALVRLKRLPLTSNGKIDKRALPEPDISSFITRKYEAANTEVEKILVEIWKELLHVENVGIHDNFFELGGHSLLAKRVVYYIERKLLISVPIQALFQFNTIHELGKFLEIQLTIYQKETEPGVYKFLTI
jgi:amino acid adenylation domain-containing protein